MNNRSPQFLGRIRSWTKPTTVYRMFDGDGNLLYVGAALNPFVRFADHKSRKSWYADVANVTFEHFENRADALDAEARAIWTENPKHNIFVPSEDLLSRNRGELAWQQEREVEGIG